MSASGISEAAREPLPLEVQLRRYDRSYRRRLRRLAGESRQLRDLVATFPAVAIILAAGQGPAKLRGEAMGLIAAGAELRRVARALGLPPWLRRLPPEAFGDGMMLVGVLPASERFSHRVANHLPSEVAATRAWLGWLVEACRLSDEDFAVWIAAQRFFAAGVPGPEPLVPLAAYAWYSRRDAAEVRTVIGRGWDKSLGFARAVDEAHAFVRRLAQEHCRDGRGSNGRWFVVQRVSGLRFVPLRTPAELEHEGQRMNNCVGGYAGAVADGACLIYGIRRGNEHVATLEVRQSPDRDGRPVLVQLEGPGNGPPSATVERAVATWITRQGRFPLLAGGGLGQVTIDEARWARFWEPFWSRNAVTRQLAAEPVGAQMMRLRMSLATLAELART